MAAPAVDADAKGLVVRGAETLKRNTWRSALVILAYEASVAITGMMWWFLFLPVIRNLEGRDPLSVVILGLTGVWVLYIWMGAVNKRFFGPRTRLEAAA